MRGLAIAPICPPLTILSTYPIIDVAAALFVTVFEAIFVGQGAWMFRRQGAVDDAAPPPVGEAYWKELVLAVAAINTGFFLAFVVQTLGYIAAQPWTAGPRPF